MSFNPDITIVSVSADTALTELSEFALVDASDDNLTITLPPATYGLDVYVKKMDASSNTVSITAPSGTLDGVSSVVMSSQYETRHIVSDGTDYFVIS